MTFTFECPHCGQHISATSADSGITASCPNCTTDFTVPADPDSTPPTIDDARFKADPNAWTIFREAIAAFMVCPAQMLGLAFVCIAIGAVLAWVPLLGVLWLYNAIGVIQQLAPRLAKGESWDRIWQNGLFKTTHDWNLGMKFLGQVLLVGLSALPVCVILFPAIESGIIARQSYIGKIIALLAPTAMFYVHTRIMFLPTMPPVPSATKAVFAATRGRFWRLAPITAIKWILVSSSLIVPALLTSALAIHDDVSEFLMTGIPFFIISIFVWPFLGLLNNSVQESLFNPTSNANDRIA